MQALARNGFTEAQVMAALHGPARREGFRFDLLDADNKLKSPLTDVSAGSISYNALADNVKRTARFTIRDRGVIDFLSDRVRPWYRLWVPPGRTMRTWAATLPWQIREEVLQQLPERGGWAEWPLGVFLLTTPPRRSDGAVITREVEAYDLGQILLDTKVATERYTVPAGANYIVEVAKVLTLAGLTAQNLTATSLTLPTDRDWWPGTPYAQIVQDLLDAINYEALWFDGNGVATAAPYTPPAQRAPSYEYQDDLKSVTLPGVEQRLDLWGVPNQWVLVYSEADYTSLMSVYTNSNPSSPTSTVRRKRVITDVKQVDAADQATLDGLAQRYAAEASQVYEQVPWSSPIMPMHEHADVYRFTYTQLGISDLYSETEWAFELRAGATMQHTCRRVVTV